MYERLNDINTKPKCEEALRFIGASKHLFESIDNVLVNELHAKKEISFSAHDKCWGIDYKANKKLSCEIGFEKDSVFIVAKLGLAKGNIKNFENMYDSLSPYAKICVDSSPWRHVGFVEYRVLTAEHIDDLIIMLNCRVNEKQKRKPTK